MGNEMGWDFATSGQNLGVGTGVRVGANEKERWEGEGGVAKKRKNVDLYRALLMTMMISVLRIEVGCIADVSTFALHAAYCTAARQGFVCTVPHVEHSPQEERKNKKGMLPSRTILATRERCAVGTSPCVRNGRSIALDHGLGCANN